MPKRRALINIAQGLTGSFISRNNDVNGYWGIGKLYLLMEKNSTFHVTIDIVKKTISPSDDEFTFLIEEYARRLREQIIHRGLKESYVKKAKIEVFGFPNEPILELGKIAPNRVKCVFTIETDTSKIFTVEAETHCRPHDPRKEICSTRKFKN